MSNRKRLAIIITASVLVCVIIAAALFVWPGPYRYTTQFHAQKYGQGYFLRTDRLTGDTEHLRAVYVTRTGECYHRGNCFSLRYSRKPLPIQQAKKHYRPCLRCRPDITY